jgi:RNA polymerase sigma-70 factor (ECF subfamily)
MDFQEKEIINLLKSDSEKAIKIIFEVHYEGLCSYAESILKDQFMAEEVVEQLFVYLWMNADSINILSSLKSYLFRSVHNNCLKYIDKHKNESKHFHNYVFEDEEILSYICDDNFLSKLFANELERKLDDVLQTLPEQCRNIYFLSRYQNLSYPEIAKKLNISTGTVKTQMSRAFQKLREQLKDYLPLFFFII